MQETISRSKAVEAELVRYFTGKPCKHGHICERYTKNRECVQCATNRLMHEKSKDARRRYSRSTKAQVLRSKHKTTPIEKAAKAARNRQWRRNNIEDVREQERNRYRDRMTNLHEKIAKTLRRRMRETVRGIYLSNSVADYAGCSIEDLKQHLELQFKPGMTWDNYGTFGWHIDHIKPCVSFDLTDEIQVRACFHYSNLQPLWWRENLSKGTKTA